MTTKTIWPTSHSLVRPVGRHVKEARAALVRGDAVKAVEALLAALRAAVDAYVEREAELDLLRAAASKSGMTLEQLILHAVDTKEVRA